MRGPKLEHDGDALIWVFGDIGIAVGFDQLREIRGGLSGEISIQTDAPMEAAKRGHFHWAKLDLYSTSARTALAKYLYGRNDRINWTEILEVSCVKTVELWRQGETVVDLSALEASEQDEYLVEKLLPKGDTTVLFADGGSGKSILALAVGIAVRCNLNLPNGLRPNEQGNVLYLDWETNAPEQAKRIRWLARGFGVEPPAILYRPMLRGIADDVQRIRQEIRRHAVSLVIVDSIGLACGSNPNDPDVAIRTSLALRNLEATKLVIAHLSRAGAEQKEGGARPFGSVFWWNMARSVWELRRGSDDGGDDNQMHVALFHRKTNQGRLQRSLGFSMEFDEATCVTRLREQSVTDDPELAAHDSLSIRVREALRRGAREVSDLAEELGKPTSTIRQTLRRMPDAQRLDEAKGRGKSGLWGLAEFRGAEPERF